MGDTSTIRGSKGL